MNKEQVQKQLHEMFDCYEKYSWIEMNRICYLPYFQSYMYIERIDYATKTAIGMIQTGNRAVVPFHEVVEAREVEIINKAEHTIRIIYQHRDENGNWVE